MVQGLLIVEASQLHPDTPHSVRLLWTDDHPKQRPLRDNTQQLPLRYSNPQSPQASGSRPTRSHLNQPSNGTYRGKSKHAGEKKSVSVSLCCTQIPCVLAWHCTRAFTVRGRQLRASAMARPYGASKLQRSELACKSELICVPQSEPTSGLCGVRY